MRRFDEGAVAGNRPCCPNVSMTGSTRIIQFAPVRDMEKRGAVAAAHVERVGRALGAHQPEIAEKSLGLID